MAVKRRKKKNIFVRYFTPFGLKQICDITMFVAMIFTILGLILFAHAEALLPIGLFLFIGGAALAITRSVLIMLSVKNRRAPEFRHALVNIIIMSIILVVAAFAVWYYFVKL